MSLNGRDGKPILTRHADASGVVVFSDLPMGDSQFEASCQGFASSTITVTIVGSEEAARDVILKAGTVGTVIAAPPPQRSEPRIPEEPRHIQESNVPPKH